VATGDGEVCATMEGIALIFIFYVRSKKAGKKKSFLQFRK
jgi:hypothetical protein